MAWRYSRWFNGMRLVVHMEFLHDVVCGLSYSMAFALHLSHCIGIWSYVAASSRDRTGTTSFIDASSYLVGYEGRRHGICIAYALWFWIMAYLSWIQYLGETLRSDASPWLGGDRYLSCIWSIYFICCISWIITGLPLIGKLNQCLIELVV